MQSNGKSTLVSKIISPAFGGRSASAKLMMSGRTGFNSELAEGELITFDDIPNNLSPSETANMLKTFLVGHELGMQVHAKGQDAVTIPVLHRLVWCCNNDANALRNLLLANLATSGYVVKPPKTSSSKAAIKWLVAGIAARTGAEG